MHRSISLALALVPLLVGARSASAVPISISNASFEQVAVTLGIGDFTCAPSCVNSGSTTTSDPIVGWVLSDPTLQGTFQPSAASYPGGGSSSDPAVGIPDGVNVAYLSAGSDMISQVLSETLQTDVTYILKVDVGNRSDLGFPTTEIRLLAGTTTLASANVVAPSNGTFETATVLFSVPSVHPNEGDLLQIQIARGGNSPNIQLNVDNVRLSVPEPNLAILLGTGIAGLAWRSRRR